MHARSLQTNHYITRCSRGLRGLDFVFILSSAVPDRWRQGIRLVGFFIEPSSRLSVRKFPQERTGLQNKNHFHKAFRLFVFAMTVLASAHLLAQGLDPATIANPPADSWPSYHGDYSGRRHSPLTQITPQNVSSLGLAWAFQTGQAATLKSSPLLVNGILYFTVPDNVWAVDARSGHQIWRYTYPPNKGLHIGHRGVAMYKEWLYFITPDAHLISLERQERQSPVECPDRRCRQGILVHHVTAGGARSRDRRRRRRLG